MDYESTLLKQDMIIDRIVTVHYFEYTNDFIFAGEEHDFWELLYVDKGEIDVSNGHTTYILKKGEVIFHKPMEFHNLWANGVTAPNLVVIAFESDSPAIKYFEDKILRMGDSERDLLAKIIREAQDSFSSPLDDPNLKRLERRDKAPFGSEQLIKINLEQMLIQLIRKKDISHSIPKTTSSIKEKSDHDIYNNVLLYLEENIYKRITLKEVCKNNHVGYSYLQKMFKQKSGGGVMEYFGKIKIQRARQFIRENTLNFTEIAHKLGYGSIYYFSRHFKKITGMTPSEYATSVKVRSEVSKDQFDLLK